jgi:BACON domain-containing protein
MRNPKPDSKSPERRVHRASSHAPRTVALIVAWSVILAIIDTQGEATAQNIMATIPIPSHSASGLDVNPTTNLIYTSGGASFSSQQITIIDGNTNSIIGTVPGSGAHVNPLTNRVYAGQLNPSRILVYDGITHNLVTQIAVAGCAIEAVVDTTINRVYGAAQCGNGNDPVFPIDGATNTLLNPYVRSGGVMGSIVSNPVTHIVYIGPSNVSREVDPTSFVVTNAPFSGVVVAANPATNRLYAQAAGLTQVIDGSTEAVVGTLSASGTIAVDSTRNRIYVADGPSLSVRIFDGVTNDFIGTIALPAGSSTAGPIAVNSSTGLIYVIANNASGAALLVIAAAPPPPPRRTCEPGTDHLCLDASRFSVKATWTTPAGSTGSGQAVALTDDTGYYWFFDSSSVEVVTKLVDGCGVNGHFWVFAAGLTNVQVLLTVTDTTTGSVATYTNPQNRPFSPIQDTSAFVCGSSAPPPKPRAPLPRVAAVLSAKAAPVAPTVCDPSDATTLCLNANRFSVQTLWQTLAGSSGVGQAVSITSDTGYFWFFDAGSVEVVVKVLNGCDLNQQFWVFAAGLTDVAVTITITDVITGQARTYRNPQNTPFAPLQDTSALATCLPSCDSKHLTVQQVNQAATLSALGLSDPFGADFNLLSNRFMAREGCGLQNASSSSLSTKTTAHPCPDPTCATTQCDGVQYCGPGNSCDGKHSYLSLLSPSTLLNNGCFAHDTCYTKNCVPDACYFDASSQATPCDPPLVSICDGVTAKAIIDNRCEPTSDCLICDIVTLVSMRPTSLIPKQCQVPPCTRQDLPQVCNTSTGMCAGVSIEPTSQSFPASGGSDAVSVTVPSGQLWTAVSHDAWVAITFGASEIGNGKVLYSVDANNGSGDRMGTMTISGLYPSDAIGFSANFTVTQAGSSSCSYALSLMSQSFPSSGGSGSVSVTAPSGCPWTAVSNSNWITIPSGGSGSGNGIVSYSVNANQSTSQLTGSMTIAGLTFKVTQAGGNPSCSYALSAMSQSFPSSGGSGSVSVTAPSGCPWTAVSNNNWITIPSGSSGSGNGIVSYSVNANQDTSQRTGTMTIAGLAFSVIEAGGTGSITFDGSYSGSDGCDCANLSLQIVENQITVSCSSPSIGGFVYNSVTGSGSISNSDVASFSWADKSPVQTCSYSGTFVVESTGYCPHGEAVCVYGSGTVSCSPYSCSDYWRVYK